MIVGASIAGSTAAILLGRAGLRFALIHRRSRLDDFKNAVHSPRHGLRHTHDPPTSASTARSRPPAVSATDSTCTRRGDGSSHLPTCPTVTASVAKSSTRRCAGPWPRPLGSSYDSDRRPLRCCRSREAFGYATATGPSTRFSLLWSSGRTAFTSVAALAGGTTRLVPNNRFMYFAEFTGVRLNSTGGPNCGCMSRRLHAMPNDGGVTVLATMPTKAELPSFRSHPEAALLAALRKLPDAPRFDPAGRVSKIIGAPDCPLVTRTAVPASTLDLIGDAAPPPTRHKASDAAGRSKAPRGSPTRSHPRCLPAARSHRRYADTSADGRSLRRHQTTIEQEAKAEPPTAIDRLIMRAAVHDAKTAAHLFSYVNRRITPTRFLIHPALARAVYVNARSHTSSPRQRQAFPAHTE